MDHVEDEVSESRIPRGLGSVSAPTVPIGTDPSRLRALSADAERVEVSVDQAVGGNREALAQLLGFIHPLVVRYCRARLSSGHRSLSGADDLAQEVCMAVINALPTYRRDGRPFLAFVYAIAANKVVDAHRAAGRSRSVPVADLPEVATDEPGPEHRAVAGSVTGTMNELLARLPKVQQEILRLRVAVGLSADETAEALGMTAGAVRVAQHRALSKLRSIVEGSVELSEQLI